MDYFRKYLGAQQSGNTPSSIETVSRLCDRVKSSTLLEDRRDAIRAIKSLSKKFRWEVGSQALEVLLSVLQNDRADTEITGYAVETLCNILNNEPLDDDDEQTVEQPENLGLEFTDNLLSYEGTILLFLSLLDEYDFHVRWPTVRLLTIILANKGKELQEVILVSPMGVLKLMDLLSDSREIIRNDGVLLLIQLTKSNPNIQKIVAFEGAFEGLLKIIAEEGSSDGGIVVEDCLLLMLNLLKSNSSNQTYFKEGSFIKALPIYFELENVEDSPDGGWSAQKVSNIHLMLQIVRTLVSPRNPAQQTVGCQKVMNQCGLLQTLCSILMASGVPADVLTETINTVSEIIRGNVVNQEYFASVMAPSSPPRPAIVVLLMSMVNDKQPFVLRCAVLYCFQSFLYKNDLGQTQIVQTLLPTTSETNTISAGQLLCSGLFSTDVLSTWFASVALLHSIMENKIQKEQLLRVQLATSLGNPPISLLQQCVNMLTQGEKLQTHLGILMLLSHWLANCPTAVAQFLHTATNVQFLISQISASEENEHDSLLQGLCAFLLGICVHFNNDQVESYQRQHLRQIIDKRIGVETFSDKLNHLSKNESYAKAAKGPQILYTESNEILFDYEFSLLFKKLEAPILKSITSDAEEEEEKKSVAAHDGIVEQYKVLIREQDTQLNDVKDELSKLQISYAESQTLIEELKTQVQTLKDQNALLRINKENSESIKLHSDLETKNKEVEEKDLLIEKLKNDLSIMEEKPPQIVENGTEHFCNGNVSPSEQESSRVLIDELNNKIAQRDEEIKLYRGKFEDASKQICSLNEKLSSGSQDDEATLNIINERNMLSQLCSEKDVHMQQLKSQYDELLESQKELTSSNDTIHSRLQSIESMLESAEKAKDAANEELENFKKEQEDLLVLLADQDTKLTEYKDKLKSYGEQIEDDDLDDSDDLEDEEDDQVD